MPDEGHCTSNIFFLCFMNKDVPSAFQQRKIRDMNSTLQREQLEAMQCKEKMVMVGHLWLQGDSTIHQMDPQQLIHKTRGLV